jgi:hypothetical protein
MVFDTPKKGCPSRHLAPLSRGRENRLPKIFFATKGVPFASTIRNSSRMIIQSCIPSCYLSPETTFLSQPRFPVKRAVIGGFWCAGPRSKTPRGFLICRHQVEPLFADLRGNDSFPAKRPLLAHYTSIGGLEAILRTNELWLSNPLFMNDMEEVRFGIHTGARLFLGSSEIESACRNKQRFDLLKSSFNSYFNTFDSEHVLDTYVFCLSVHSNCVITIPSAGALSELAVHLNRSCAKPWI